MISLIRGIFKNDTNELTCETDLENLWLPKRKGGEEGYIGIDMYTLPYLKLMT